MLWTGEVKFITMNEKENQLSVALLGPQSAGGQRKGTNNVGF